MTRKKIEIDRCNAHQYWLMAKQLREGRLEYEKLAHKYPLELTAFGFRRVVCNIAEIDELIADIDHALALYRRQKPKHRRPCDMSCFKMGERFVSQRNVASVRSFIVALQSNRDFLRKSLRRYPTDAMAYGMYFLFSDLREVDWVIGALKRKVREVEVNAGKRWWEGLLALGA